MLRSYQPMLPDLIKLLIDFNYSCIVILIFFKLFQFNLSTIFFPQNCGLNFIPVIEEALYRGKVTICTQSFINYYKVDIFWCLFLPYFASAMIFILYWKNYL